MIKSMLGELAEVAIEVEVDAPIKLEVEVDGTGVSTVDGVGLAPATDASGCFFIRYLSIMST